MLLLPYSTQNDSLTFANDFMIGSNIIRLAHAMAEFEGWQPEAVVGPEIKTGTLSFKNNNPLNLTASPLSYGKNGRFAVFYSEDLGWSAAYWDIMKKCSGETSTGLNGEKTLTDLIAVWAPPHENPTQKYIDYVVSRTGFPADMKLKRLLCE